MKTSFASEFENFLTERIGKEIARFRTCNEEYRKALQEYDDIKNKAKSGSIADERAALLKLIEVGESIRYIETHFLFLAGMGEYKNLSDAISSPEFFCRFSNIEKEN